MEAKDTVMTNSETKMVIDKGVSEDRNIDVEPEQIYRYVREAQAEISFKAGMREVVDDIVKLMDYGVKPETFTIKVCDYCEAKLKEWGVKDG